MGFYELRNIALANGDWHPYSGAGFFLTPKEGVHIQAHFQHSSQVDKLSPTDAWETMVTGQAAGAAAALCVKKNVTPRQLEDQVKELQDVLVKQGAILFETVKYTAKYGI
jgi:hypothetical protein